MGRVLQGMYLLAAIRRHGGIAQLVEQTAHIRSVIGPSPIAATIQSSSCSSISEKKAGELEFNRPALEACRKYSDLGGEL